MGQLDGAEAALRHQTIYALARASRHSIHVLLKRIQLIEVSERYALSRGSCYLPTETEVVIISELKTT